MALNRIILWMGNSLVLVAMLMIITALSGVILGEWVPGTQFGAMAMVVGLIGIIFVGATRNTPARESHTDALVFLLLFWMAIPPVLALPYLITTPVDGLTEAYFEAVSAVTTTGASTLEAAEIPKTVHIWRSALQWIGGVIVATFAVVILAALNLRGTGVHRSMLFTLKRGELFDRLVAVGRVIAGIYAMISTLCFVCLIMTGTPVFDALCLSLTSVSTGGLTPRDGLLVNYVNPIGVIALALTCLLGAANIAVLWDMVRLRSFRGVRPIFENVEHRALFVVTGVLILVGLFYTGIRHIPTLLAEAAFFASSTGYDYHVIGLDVTPQAFLIAIALIGGSALSTAGGVKLIRLLLLFRHLETDLSRLTHPSRTYPVMFRGQILPDSAFLSIWMYFFGYTVVFASGILALASVGMDFQVSVATSAASLANFGPLLDATMPPFTYSDFTSSQLIVSSILMLVGRVEVLAALAVLSPGLWRA